MTEADKERFKRELATDFKMYAHIDYNDDADIVELMINVTLEELTELIPNFDPYSMTSRQRLLALVFTKELYDNREKYQKDTKSMANAVSSMLLKEKYRGGRA